MKDSYHMKEHVQKRVHEAIWNHMDAGMGAPIPIVVLDFNAGAASTKRHYQRYVGFFENLGTFGRGDPSQTWTVREERLRARDHLVQAVGNAYPTLDTFTVKGRTKVASEPECSISPWNPSEWGTSLRCQGFFYDPELLGRCINQDGWLERQHPTWPGVLRKLARDLEENLGAEWAHVASYPEAALRAFGGNTHLLYVWLQRKRGASTSSSIPAPENRGGPFHRTRVWGARGDPRVDPRV